MSALNIQSLCRNQKDFPKLSLFASSTGAMINPQWLELPMSRMNFHGPKHVRAIEVRLYVTSKEPNQLAHLCSLIFTNSMCKDYFVTSLSLSLSEVLA